MLDLFSFFKRFRSPPRTGAPVPFSTYDAFEHRFTDSPVRFRLVCLGVDGCDWGRHARFTEPIMNPDGDRIFMWELKWVPALHEDRDFPRTGWHRREVLVNLVARTFEASAWKAISAAPVKIAPRWHLVGKARDIAAFRSPPDERGNPIRRVTEDLIEVLAHGESKTFHWAELRLIHFTRTAVNTMATPVNEATLEGGGYATARLPDDLSHPFYRQLVKRGHIEQAALEAFFARDSDSELTVLSARGDIALADVDEEQALATLWNAAPGERIDVGGLLVQALKPDHERGLEDFPPRRFHFDFSTINGKGNRALWRDEIARWRKTLRPGWRVTYREQGHPVLELHGARLALTLHYSRSSGTGWFTIDPWWYRHRLLQEARWQTDFPPTHSSVIPNATVSSHYGRPAACLLPAPDALHRPQLTLWRDDAGRCGLTHEGWLYLWRRDEVASIEDGVSDALADRGGPYYEIDIVFAGNARLTLRRGNGSATELIAFFQ
ncbi:hypothetical protein [Pseudoduganella armeniaca]|uniref:Uncharacterized protein n=1 Tax=Pseudoduganella armeniaca TaxID=2072590 RepID=A0A2R4C6G0_9BURK|nr:hypothetical protein [Pseudoduganella armeniaca]AVR95195.1 hypothetical protein C9I28_05235 [Pseudoduganella armeniaca]